MGLFRSAFLAQNGGMIYGYARVSTDAQDISNQVAQPKAVGGATTFGEKISLTGSQNVSHATISGQAA